MKEKRPALTLDRLKELLAQGKTDAEITAIVGCSVDAPGKLRRRHGLPINPAPKTYHGGGRRQTYDREEIKAMLKQKYTGKQIIEKLGCTHGPITAARRELGISIPHPAKKLKPFNERLADARKMIAEEASFAEITRTTHVNGRRLRKEFPGHQWSASQAGRHGMMIRYGEKTIEEAWGSGSKRLTNPPGTR